MTPIDATALLRRASELSDLTRPRLETKVDMSSHAIAARLREASDLLDLCLRLAEATPKVAAGQ